MRDQWWAWNCEWEGLRIKVERAIYWNRRPATEALYVNDNQVDFNEVPSRVHRQAYLAAPISVDGSVRRLEAILGYTVDKREPRCHIFVDGQRIGGDTEEEPVEEPAAMWPSEWELTQSRGIVRHLFVHGVLKYGIPCALAFLTFYAFEGAPWFHDRLGHAVVFVGCFAVAGGYFSWWRLKRNFENAKRKLEGPPRFTI